MPTSQRPVKQSRTKLRQARHKNQNGKCRQRQADRDISASPRFKLFLRRSDRFPGHDLNRQREETADKNFAEKNSEKREQIGKRKPEHRLGGPH